MKAPPQPPTRPAALTLIAVFQGALTIYLLYFVTLALLNPPDNLGSLRSALRLLIGRTDYRSYAGSPHQEIAMALFSLVATALAIAVYSAIEGWGLWRLKKWARHSVASGYGLMVLLWARSFLFFGVGGGFSRVPADALQPIYMVIVIEAMICLILLFHGGVAEAFGEVD